MLQPSCEKGERHHLRMTEKLQVVLYRRKPKTMFRDLCLWKEIGKNNPNWGRPNKVSANTQWALKGLPIRASMCRPVCLIFISQPQPPSLAWEGYARDEVGSCRQGWLERRWQLEAVFWLHVPGLGCKQFLEGELSTIFTIDPEFLMLISSL